MSEQKKPESCAGCQSSSTKLTFLGFRTYCKRFKCLRVVRCIDYREKK